MNLTCLKSDSWRAELRVPQDVRPVIGKTRFAKSTGTRNKREVVLRAAPMLEQWQSDIELAKLDPQALIAKHHIQRLLQWVVYNSVGPGHTRFGWCSIRILKAFRKRFSC